MADNTAPQIDMKAHERTYEGFITGSVAFFVSSAIVLIALVMFGFGSGASASILGFIGLVVGLAAVVIDMARGGKKWTLSLVVTGLFLLVTLFNVA